MSDAPHPDPLAAWRKAEAEWKRGKRKGRNRRRAAYIAGGMVRKAAPRDGKDSQP